GARLGGFSACRGLQPAGADPVAHRRSGKLQPSAGECPAPRPPWRPPVGSAPRCVTLRRVTTPGDGGAAGFSEREFYLQEFRGRTLALACPVGLLRRAVDPVGA